MRILVGGFGHESNTLTPFLTRLADFHPRYGAETLDSLLRRGASAGVAGVFWKHPAIELVPTIPAHAMRSRVTLGVPSSTTRQRQIQREADRRRR